MNPMVTIISGPSEEKLFESFLTYCSGEQTKVSFLTETKKITGVIDSLSHADEKGLLVRFGGFFDLGIYLRGYYNMSTKTGWVDDWNHLLAKFSSNVSF